MDLVYISVFLNKEILEYLKLFLFSMKLYSNIETFDILIMTSPDFISDINTISKQLDIPLKIFTMNCQTLNDVMLSRFKIFEYPSITNYKKLLYLDIDILIQNDLTLIFSLHINDKVYAVIEPDTTIESNQHGLAFFDFKTIDKSTPGVNAGVILFNNSPTITYLFTQILNKGQNSSDLGIDQSLLNYFCYTQGLFELSLLSNFVFLSNKKNPVSPIADANIILNHFYGGNKIPKIQRMKYHLSHLLELVMKISDPRTIEPLLFRQYTWNIGKVVFQKNNVIVTTWGRGKYKCLYDRIYEVQWSGNEHIIIFSEDFKRFTLIRLKDFVIDGEQETTVLKDTIPDLIEVEEPILENTKSLVYFCVFHNRSYLKLLELLLLSIKLYSPCDLEFLILTSESFVGQVKDLINKLHFPLHIMTMDITSQHGAGCARLRIFEYEFINNYSKILYLDTDILIQGNLTRLFDLLVEDKVYAMKEYDIYGVGHGAYFFDFTTIDKTHPSLNSGTLLFKNSRKIRSVFATINKHISNLKESGSLLPGCMDQSFIAYNLIKYGLCDLDTITPYIYLSEKELPPIIGSIIISHFVWPIGNADHKFERISLHFKTLLNSSDEMIYNFNNMVLKLNPKTLEYTNERRIPSFNLIIATTGKPCLQRMLDSLMLQLEDRDCLTIVYDGHSTRPGFDLRKFTCKIIQECEPVALGHWGHGIRNKYGKLLEKRDFVIHADDDNLCRDGYFKHLRKECYSLNTLYISKVQGLDGKMMPKSNQIVIGEIDTSSGVIPYNLNSQGIWQNVYGGDGMFYKILESKASAIQFLDFNSFVSRPKDK
jgi:hypothetical protein